MNLRYHCQLDPYLLLREISYISCSLQALCLETEKDGVTKSLLTDCYLCIRMFIKSIEDFFYLFIYIVIYVEFYAIFKNIYMYLTAASIAVG